MLPPLSNANRSRRTHEIRLVSHAVANGFRNWGTLPKFGLLHAVSVKFFLNRSPPSIAQLAPLRGRCPIAMIHCSEDVAYPIEYAEESLELCHKAGVDATLESIEGAPHFGNITNSKESVFLLY